MNCSLAFKIKSLTAFALTTLLVSTASSAETADTLASAPVCESSDARCLIIEEKSGYELSGFGKIEFVAVPEDSRCPVDALCFWAGQVKVELKHAYQGTVQKFVVGLGDGLEPSYWDELTGQHIVLEQVWPEPSLSNPIGKPYQIKLRLEDPASPADPSLDNANQQESAEQSAPIDALAGE